MFWYVATPYSKYPEGREQAYIDACKAASYLIKSGLRVFCPIAHSHAISEHGGVDPNSHEIWLGQDLAFWHSAHGMIVAQMPSWEISHGVNVEIAWFTSHRRPIYYLQWPLELNGAEGANLLRRLPTEPVPNVA